MTEPTKPWLLFAASILGAGGVLIGAFGAHALPDYLVSQGTTPEVLTKRLDQFDTGARYHLVHAVVVLLLAVMDSVGARQPGLFFRNRLSRSAILFVVGTLLFSGSLYLLVLTGKTWLGAVTPIGGVSWIAAWIQLAFCRKS